MAEEEIEAVIAELAAAEPVAEEGSADETLVQWIVSYATYRQ
jgi:hypothetical protein